MRNITVGPAGHPTLDENLLLARSMAPLPEGCIQVEIDAAQVTAQKHCFGKMLLRACYHYVSNLIHRLRRGRIDFNTFVDVALSCLQEQLPNNIAKRDYYDQALPVL